MNGHATFLSRRTLYGFLAVVPVLIALGSFVDHPLSLALYLPVSPALLAGGRPRSEWFSAYKNSCPCRAAVFIATRFLRVIADLVSLAACLLQHHTSAQKAKGDFGQFAP